MKHSLYELRVRRVRRSLPEHLASVDNFTAPQGVFEVARHLLRDEHREVMLCFCLDHRHALIGVHTVAVGTARQLVISPRETFIPALLTGAIKVILAHNHPSGDPSPSTDDIELSQRFRKAGEVLDVELLDHIIVGHSSFYAFSEHNWGLPYLCAATPA